MPTSKSDSIKLTTNTLPIHAYVVHGDADGGGHEQDIDPRVEDGALQLVANGEGLGEV
jgi:hypothetical protein